jgi:uncharacterized protein
MHHKPEDVFGRDAEWADLNRFVDARGDDATLGIVYGRRRQGKSLLLDALAETTGGFYFEAGQTSTEQNLARFAVEWARHRADGTPRAFRTWEAAFAEVLRSTTDRPRAIVIDEFGYLVAADPSLPSTLQRLFGPRSTERRGSSARLILCGSAFTTMAGLLSGTAPLRGRATLELIVGPFDYLSAARFWGLEGIPDAAVFAYGLVGGTPAYRDFCNREVPRSAREIPAWVQAHLLNPSSALHREGRVVVDEDPNLRDRTMAWAMLTAVADGARTRTAIADTIGRDSTSLSRPLDLLTTVGLLVRDDDLLRGRRGTYRVGEPVIAAHHLLVAPNERRLARRLAGAVWDDNEHAVRSRLIAPAFELIAREWLESHGTSLLGSSPTAVGWTKIPCRRCPYQQSSHQIDVLAVERTTGGQTRVTALGEARWRTEPFNRSDLDRLVHVRAAVAEVLPGSSNAAVFAFSRGGFTADTERTSRTDSTIHLVDVAELYR